MRLPSILLRISFVIGRERPKLRFSRQHIDVGYRQVNELSVRFYLSFTADRIDFTSKCRVEKPQWCLVTIVSGKVSEGYLVVPSEGKVSVGCLVAAVSRRTIREFPVAEGCSRPRARASPFNPQYPSMLAPRSHIALKGPRQSFVNHLRG